MLTKSAAEWKNMATRILDAAGSVHEESVWVAESLVDANLAGHDTHLLSMNTANGLSLPAPSPAWTKYSFLEKWNTARLSCDAIKEFPSLKAYGARCWRQLERLAWRTRKNSARVNVNAAGRAG